MEKDARTFAFKANLNAFPSTNAFKDFSEAIMEEEGLLKDCVLVCFSNYSLTLDECNCNVIHGCVSPKSASYLFC